MISMILFCVVVALLAVYVIIKLIRKEEIEVILIIMVSLILFSMAQHIDKSNNNCDKKLQQIEQKGN